MKATKASNVVPSFKSNAVQRRYRAVIHSMRPQLNKTALLSSVTILTRRRTSTLAMHPTNAHLPLSDSPYVLHGKPQTPLTPKMPLPKQTPHILNPTIPRMNPQLVAQPLQQARWPPAHHMQQHQPPALGDCLLPAARDAAPEKVR